jgi:hypothetical protein
MHTVTSTTGNVFQNILGFYQEAMVGRRFPEQTIKSLNKALE